VGINSRVGKDKHFLFWDFDDVDLIDVCGALKEVQKRYHLPSLYVFNTGKPGHFYAICPKLVSFKKACEIIAATRYIDLQFYRLGIMRWRWTLRISNKPNRENIKLACIIDSDEPTVDSLGEIKSFVLYETPVK